MASVRLPLTLASLLLATPAHAQSKDEWDNAAITQLNRQGAHTLEMPVDEQHAMLRGTWQTDRSTGMTSAHKLAL